MSSQRISELYSSITIKSKQDFFKSWYAKISEKEYIVLDITSISTYSTGMKDAEFGYNRDHEKLPQINLCILFGEKNTSIQNDLIDITAFYDLPRIIVKTATDIYSIQTS